MMLSPFLGLTMSVGLVAAVQAGEDPAMKRPRPVTVPVIIPDTEVHPLHSEQTGQDYRLFVAHPPAGPPLMGRGTSGPPAVVYVLDANLVFGTVVETARLMRQLTGELPPLLIVGIAYATDDRLLVGQLRGRDFTPTKSPSFDRQAAIFLPPDAKPLFPEGEGCGKAGEFLDFIREDVKPFISEHYQVEKDNDTVIGVSLGGLFALYTLFEAPDTFRSYIVGSPAIWWDDGVLFNMEKESAAEGRDLNARVFLAVGGLEEEAQLAFLAPYKMVSNLEEMAKRLRARGNPGLEVWTQVFERETHASVVGATVSRGLRTVFLPR
ncbi:MAG: alpha/beta hydrolase-fold protein [Planctomycetota bacterium]